MEERIKEILFEHDPQKARCVDGYWVCPACGYDYGVFAPEVVEDELDEFGHLASVITELVTEYQAKAWDKGFDKGSHAFSHWWDRLPGRSNKENRNPYRWQLERNGRR